MIIYDRNFNIIGISKKALDILEFKNYEEFLKTHKNLNSIIVGHEKMSDEKLINYILSLPKQSKKVHVKSRSGKILMVELSIKSAIERDDSFYELNFALKDETADEDDAINELQNSSNLRLPIIFGENRENQNKNLEKKAFVITKEWLEQTILKLNLTKNEFLEYLKIFIQNANQIDISLQNFVITQDYIMVKKTINRLKEPAMNLHLTPLVQIYNEILHSPTYNYHELINSTKECVDSIAKLLQNMDKK